MSRFVLPLKDGGEIAYGFDHALGPFFERWADPDKDDVPVEDHTYAFSPGRHFDCYALANKLSGLAEQGEIEVSDRLEAQIYNLWMDLPI
jgi:hypothetical protein